MKVEIVIDTDCLSPRLVIYAREITEEINELVKRLSDTPFSVLIGYQDDKLVVLQPETLVRVYSEQQKVFAQTSNETYTLRLRLYEVEEKLNQSSFIRISNSEIVNFTKVKNLDLSLSGTICIVFQSGLKTFVSRRYMSKIKTYLGL